MSLIARKVGLVFCIRDRIEKWIGWKIRIFYVIDNMVKRERRARIYRKNYLITLTFYVHQKRRRHQLIYVYTCVKKEVNGFKTAW